jgi:SAM-dependent methyltransferase
MTGRLLLSQITILRTVVDFTTEERLRGLGLPAGAHHYRAYVGVPERYDELAALQFRVLTDLGLREHHRVLEVGCGSLRFGRLLLPYLLPARYVGVEPEQWLVQDGIHYELGEAIISVKKPQFCFDRDCDFSHFECVFDYVILQSVITHAPLDWIKHCARRLSAVLAEPHGIIVGTYLEGSADYQGKEWAYPECIPYRQQTMQELFAAVGLAWTTLDQYPHPASVTWFLFHRGSTAVARPK